MRVFVTGATGALGRRLVPGLVAAGHEVTATTRTRGKVARLVEAGAEPVVLDNVDKVFAATNELRTRGTDNLPAAAARAGTRRVVAQSNVAATERSGGFYGPGASELLLDLVRKRWVPVIGGGTGISSFIEITAAAAATLAAVEGGARRGQRGGQRPGAGHGVAAVPGGGRGRQAAAAPARLLGRLLAGAFRRGPDDQLAGASNGEARKELGWEPRSASWREGFRAWVGG
jgi:nucleoside-diphosphate-sugar epimerase